MFLTFLQIMVWIRKQVNLKTKLFFIVTVAIFFSLSIVALFVDKYFQFKPIQNFVRMFLSLGIGVSLFSFLYGLLIAKQIRIDKIRKTHRAYSHLQRVNISILIISFIVTLHILLFPIGSFLYTFSAGLVIAIGICLLNFITPKSWEVNQFINGKEDIRDLTDDRKL